VVETNQTDKNGGVLAIVPARGGSKGIPGKNIKRLGGFPLIAYSIAAGLQAHSVHRVLVSTDDENIARVAREWGAEVPFLRPAELAQDNTTDWPVFDHTLRWLEENEGYQPEIVVQLRPTSPFRRVSHIDDAIALLRENAQADAVRTVCLPRENPFKMWLDGGDGWMQPLMKGYGEEPYNQPRQELPVAWWQTGSVDACRARTIRELRSMTGRRILPLKMSATDVIDMDSPADWEMSETLLASGRLQLEELGFSLTSSEVSTGAMETPRQRQLQLLPEHIEALILDFDGVFTDNRVLVSQDGSESVWCHRGDGWGLSHLKKHGFPIAVFSTEANPVVAARCRKLGLECVQNLENKGAALEQWLRERQINAANVIFVGNDVNDLDCLKLVGCPVVVADAHADVLGAARLVLETRGGHGALRELADMIEEKLTKQR
jgi:YrbI family 3-deoxy-D-manno-octulosonate 8-phosphate phosphatase